MDWKSRRITTLLEAALLEARDEMSLSFNARYLAGAAVGREHFLDKLCVPGIIFKMQNAQRRVHFSD